MVNEKNRALAKDLPEDFRDVTAEISRTEQNLQDETRDGIIVDEEEDETPQLMPEEERRSLVSKPKRRS